MNGDTRLLGRRFGRRGFLKTGAAIGAALALQQSQAGLTPAYASTLPAAAEESVIPTICGGCHNNCGMLVHVKGGKVTYIEGNPAHPMNAGHLCPKGYAAKQLLYAADRLKYPLMRVGERGEGKWRRATWDEALDHIAKKLQEVRDKYGPAALEVAVAAPVMNCIQTVFVQLPALYGTNNRSTPNNCYVNRMHALFNTYGFRNEDDYDNTRFMLMWGTNPMAAMRPGSYAAYDGFHRPILDALERGVKMVVIDPVFNETAAKAHQWIPIRPGTDGALALAMINVIISEGLYDRDFVQNWTVGFEELKALAQAYTPEKAEDITSIPAATIKALAREYATTKPALIHEGNCFAMHTNGTQGTRAVACLRAITGNLDVPGGDVCFPGTAGDRLHPVDVKPPTEKAAAPPLGADTYKLIPAGPCVIDALITGKPYPIKATIVHHTNPVVCGQDGKAVRDAYRKNLDLLVVIDIFMTPTAQMADVVLPDATFLERLDYRHHPSARGVYVALRQPAVEPLYETRPAYDIELELAKKMGYSDKFPWKTGEQLLDFVLKPSKVTVKDLREKPVRIITEPMVYKKYEKGLLRPDGKPGFATPSGKVELVSSGFKNAGYDPLPTYVEPAESPVSTPELAKRHSLIGVSRRMPNYVHSKYRSLPWLREIEPEPLIRLNPDDAIKRGLKDGDLAVAYNDRDQIKMHVKITPSVMPGVALIDGCWWKPEDPNDLSWNMNILIDRWARDPIGNLATLSSFLCEVKKA